MDGVNAMQLPKAGSATARIRIVTLTAFAMKGDKQKILASGCDAYIAKPFGYGHFPGQ